MLKPRALGQGDRIAIVAPASPFDRAQFDAGVLELERLGFRVVYDETVFARRGFVAGEPDLRAQAILAAWEDPEIAGVIGARGGYGSVQILPLLPTERLRRNPKVFVGYSDVTSLLAWFSTSCGMVCFHGPMLAGRLGRGAEGYDRESFLRSVTSREPLGELTSPGLETVRAGEAAGPLLGGTLTQLLASLGTPYAFAPPAGHILFVDEVSERPYRLDRMLTQLRFSGLLARAAAVIFGELPSCDEQGGQVTARAVVADLMRDFPGPVLYGFPSGHSVAPSVTLPLGVQARVVGGPAPRVIIEEGAVE